MHITRHLLLGATLLLAACQSAPSAQKDVADDPAGNPTSEPTAKSTGQRIGVRIETLGIT